MPTREAILQAVSSYSKRSSRIRFVPTEELKPRKRRIALDTIAPGLPEEEMLALMDTSILGTGKEGFLVTGSTLYIRELHQVRVDLDDMKEAVIEKPNYVTLRYRIRPTVVFYASVYDDEVCSFLRELIRQDRIPRSNLFETAGAPTGTCSCCGKAIIPGIRICPHCRTFL